MANDDRVDDAATVRWVPTPKDEEYVRLVMVMSADALLFRGVADRATYVSNLRMIANQIENL